MLACDILTSVNTEALAKMQKGTTKALVNTALVMPASFTRDPDLRFPLGSMEQEIMEAVGPGDAEFLDATKLATGPDGRLDRHQPVHGGLRLPARPAAAVGSGDHEGHRAQRRRRSSRTSARSSGAASPPSTRSASVQAAVAKEVPASQRLSQSLDEIDRASRRLPHRLPGRRLRAALRARSSRACASASRRCCPARPRSPRPSRASLLQAAGDQGRVRGRAPVRRDRLRRARRRAVRGRLQAHVPPGAAGPRQARPGHRRAAQARVRPVDAAGPSACWRSCAACAARRSTSSAAATSAGASAR